MTRLLVRGQSPGAARVTNQDTRLLRDLASYREEAEGLAEQITGARKRLSRLDRTLDDPALLDHPKRKEASITASLLHWNLASLNKQLSALAEQVAGVVRKLSPAAEASCCELWGSRVCVYGGTDGVWSALGLGPPSLRKGWGKGKDWS